MRSSFCLTFYEQRAISLLLHNTFFLEEALGGGDPEKNIHQSETSVCNQLKDFVWFSLPRDSLKPAFTVLLVLICIFFPRNSFIAIFWEVSHQEVLSFNFS